LAHILMQGQLSDDDIVTELFALLMFGHDTTAVTSAWAFAHIFSQPLAVESIRAESALKAGFEPDEPTYLRACILESMRLAPAVVQLFRVAEKDLTLAGWEIRQGEMVMPCLYMANHNPAVFPKPEHFLPERFLGDLPSPQHYFPFGFGTRLCIGKALAQRQMALILSTMIHHADLSLAPGYTVSPERYMVLIAPKTGTLMVRK